MVAAAATSPQLHFSSPRSSTRLLPSVFDSKAFVSSSSCPSSVVKRIHVAAAAGVRCMAVGTAVSEAAETKKKKSVYEIERLTNWLLKKEQAGVIDAELTIVLSGISMACKQIASFSLWFRELAFLS